MFWKLLFSAYHTFSRDQLLFYLYYSTWEIRITATAISFGWPFLKRSLLNRQFLPVAGRNSFIQRSLQVFLKTNFFNSQVHSKFHSSVTIFKSILAQHMLERYLVCQTYLSFWKKSLLKDTYYRQQSVQPKKTEFLYLILQIHLLVHAILNYSAVLQKKAIPVLTAGPTAWYYGLSASFNS